MNFLFNVRIFIRLIFGFTLILLLLAGITVFGITQVENIERGLSTINDVNSVKQRYAINFRGSVHDRAIALRDVVLVDSDSELNSAISEIDKLYDFYQTSAVSMDDIFNNGEKNDPQEVEILNRIKNIEKKTEPIIAQTIEYATTGDSTNAYQLLMGEARPLFTDWLAVINEFIDLQEAKNNAETQITTSIASGFSSLSYNVLFGSFLVTGLIILWVVPTFLKFNQLTKVMDQVSKGNLDIEPINSKTTCEIGNLSNAADAMIERLKTIIVGIQSESRQISQISTQLESTSTQMARGSSEQAAFVEEISSTMEEVSTNINQNAESARQTNDISVSTNAKLKNVDEKSREVIQANETINKRINIISDIAFQTNVLALNAAIEAARAGDAGKGFSVVASEVQILAEKSKSVSDEIISLTNRAYEISEQTGKVMLEAIPQMEQTSSLVQNITISTEEQNKGAQQVSQSIQQLNTISQQSAASSEKLAKSAEQLAGKAALLNEYIAFYKVRSNTQEAQPLHDSIVRNTLNQPVHTIADQAMDEDEYALHF